MVQVIKDPLGTKGARLSTQISIAGRMLVYLPHEPHIGISQKIESEQERAELRERVQSLMPDDETGGYIVRTYAEVATDDALESDQPYLRTIWHSIHDKSNRPDAPSVLYADLLLAQRVLHHNVRPDTATHPADT